MVADPAPALVAAAAAGEREQGDAQDEEGRPHGGEDNGRTPVPVAPGLEPYDIFLLDLDGCVWVGDEPTAGAVEAVSALRAAGRGLAFVTNDARHGEDDFVRKLWGLGFQAAREEIVTAGGALQHVLAEAGHATAFVIGSRRSCTATSPTPACAILNGSDMADRADVVVVSGHERLRLRRAARRGAGRAARGRGVVHEPRRRPSRCPTARGRATGSVVAAVEAATGVRRATRSASPSPQLFLTALDRLGDGRALVVGDRLDTDVAGARAAGLDGAIVLTGATSRGDGARGRSRARRSSPPRLAELVLAP